MEMIRKMALFLGEIVLRGVGWGLNVLRFVKGVEQA